MMTPERPEKPTMADRSGEKRDRNSDNTDNPPSTPNTKDNKLLRDDAKEPLGNYVEDETMENGDKGDFVYHDADEGALILFDSEASKGADVANPDDGTEEDDGMMDSEPLNSNALVKTFDQVHQEGTDYDPAVAGKATEASAVASKADKEKLTSHQNNKPNNYTNEKEKKNKNNNKKVKTTHNMDTEDEESKSNDDDTAVLILQSIKSQTQKWKGLDPALQSVMPYLPSDRTALDMDLANFLQHFNITDSDLGKDTWAGLFAKSYSLNGRRTKLFKKLGVKLAATDPYEFFEPQEFDGVRLRHGSIPNAWAGAYIFYGPGWKPEITVCLDISSGIAKPTNWWSKIDRSEIQSIDPFSSSEIFADQEGSMHDLERHLRIKFGLNTDKLIDPKDWVASFKTHRKDQQARSTLIKLALTPITVFGKDLFVDTAQSKLIASSITNFWVSAYRLAGGPWHVPPVPKPAVPSPTPPIPGPASSPKAAKSSKGVSFGAGVKSSTGLFISRGARKILPPKKAKADARKHEGQFFTISLPALNSDWKEGGPEAVGYFNELTNHLFTKDKKAILHLWDSNNSGGTLTRKSEPLKNKNQIQKYASQFFLRTGAETELRLRISHDVIPTLLELDSDTHGRIVHDHIQEKQRTIIGFLVGSSPDSANLDDMRQAHELHPVIQGLKLIAIAQAIKLAPGKNAIPWKQQVHAVHILVGESQSIEARSRYCKVFGSRNAGGYPQGIPMRFVPDISDSRLPVTPSTRVKAIKMMAKQRVFQSNIKEIITTTIAGLHMVIPKVGSYSLCQTLMAIKSFSDPEMGLFISIDEKAQDGGYVVVFTVHKTRHEEANALVPLLCILLEARFGPCIWEWFTDDAKRVLTKYKWDPDTAMVVLIEAEEEDEGMDIESDDELLQEMCNLLNIDKDQNDQGFEFDIDFVIEEAPQSKNQYGDTGSVKTFRDVCQDEHSIESTEGHLAAMDDILDPPAIEKKLRSPSPDSLTIQTDTETQATSTLSDDVAGSLEQMMLNNPELVKQLLAKNASPVKLVDSSNSNPVSPFEGVDGN